jgi:hypothetical protein
MAWWSLQPATLSSKPKPNQEPAEAPSAHALAAETPLSCVKSAATSKPEPAPEPPANR